MQSNSFDFEALASQPERGLIAVVGLGYIGLPTAVVFALRGWNVIGVDLSQRTVEMVNRSELPFVEQGLDAALQQAVDSGRLKAQREMPSADVYIVAVPTPFTETRDADLSHIDAATQEIAPMLKAGDLVVLESTSPPGTTERMSNRLLASRTELSLDGREGTDQIYVAHAPERVLPGRMMTELAANDRIIGGMTTASAILAQKVYETFCTGTVHLTDARTAEMAKLTENSFRDVNIAFANELSLICDKHGIDVWELIELANKHPRVNILRPGPGVGGHCIAVDPWFIVAADAENTRLIRTAREVNDQKPEWVVNTVVEHCRNASVGVITLLGVTFKPDVDDLRGSPAIQIAVELSKILADVSIQVVEPYIVDLPPELSERNNIELVGFDEAMKCSEKIISLVPHRQFLERKEELSSDRRLFDVCGLVANVTV